MSSHRVPQTARDLSQELDESGEAHLHLVSMTSGGFKGWRLIVAQCRTKVCEDNERCLRRPFRKE